MTRLKTLLLIKIRRDGGEGHTSGAELGCRCSRQ
jgi:hypothetical protein